MNSRDVRQAWEDNAPAWIELSRGGFDVYRDLVNTPAFLTMLPDVAGQVGLDLGCGEGHNTAMTAGRGARMVGVDISAAFARATKDGDGQGSEGVVVAVADGDALPFPRSTFDFVVAFMSLMDMPEPGRVLDEVVRVLHPGGFLQFSVSHPMSTTPVRHWVHDEAGDRVALAVGHYFDATPFTEQWLFGAAPPEVRARHRKFTIPRFPRTVSGWLNAVLDAGLTIERVAEPFADAETAAAEPRVADTVVAPYFLHVRARLRDPPGTARDVVTPP
jgi:SAM-dependent methyltransferase